MIWTTKKTLSVFSFEIWTGSTLSCICCAQIWVKIIYVLYVFVCLEYFGLFFFLFFFSPFLFFRPLCFHVYSSVCGYLCLGCLEVLLIRMCRAFNSNNSTIFFNGKFASAPFFKALGEDQLGRLLCNLELIDTHQKKWKLFYNVLQAG